MIYLRNLIFMDFLFHLYGCGYGTSIGPGRRENCGKQAMLK
jgi:hypothetical protein